MVERNRVKTWHRKAFERALDGDESAIVGIPIPILEKLFDEFAETPSAKKMFDRIMALPVVERASVVGPSYAAGGNLTAEMLSIPADAAARSEEE